MIIIEGRPDTIANGAAHEGAVLHRNLPARTELKTLHLDPGLHSRLRAGIIDLR